MSAIRVRRSARAVLATGTLVTVVAGLAACETDPGTPATSSPAVPSTTDAAKVIDAQQCTRAPHSGRVDRSARDLRFSHGHLYLGTAVGSSAPSSREQSPTFGSAAPQAVSDCHEFAKSGNPTPDVPPDTLLFTFSGGGDDGALIEFPVGELTGGALPPIGDVRPTVGPLTGPITATTEMSVGGMHYRSTGCELRLSAMSPKRAAGSVLCSTGLVGGADAFNPTDDVDGRTTPAQVPGPAMSGWFDLSP